MSDDELDLVPVSKLIEAIARRCDAVVMHLGWSLDANRSSSQPLWSGDIHKCYGLSMDLTAEIELELAEQRESPTCKHDDMDLDAGSEEDDDEEGDEWKKNT